MTGVFARSGPMPVKSALIPADFFRMPCVLASILTPSEMLIAICIVACWLVLMCLKVIGAEVTHAIRVHNLKVEAHRLRNAQRKRLSELAAKGNRQ